MNIFGYSNPIEDITKEEYNEWLKSSKWISTGSGLTSYSGLHDFSDIILKDGMLYELHYGWDVVPETDPNSKYKYKEEYFWGIKKLYSDHGQEGEGI